MLKLFIEGFKKVFNGDWCKHFTLFAITGLLSAVSIMFEGIKNGGVIPSAGKLLLALVIYIVVAIYLAGYGYKFMHNSFHEKDDVMPNINFEHFRLFFKALWLVIGWGLIFSGIGVVMALLLPSLGIVGGFVAIPLVIFLLLYAIFLQFVYVEFSKNFDRTGLFNIKLPLIYMKHSFGCVLLLGLIYFVANIATIILCGIIGFIAGIMGIKVPGAIEYICGLIGGYMGFVLALCWQYGLVQIYKRRIEPNLDNEID